MSRPSSGGSGHHPRTRWAPALIRLGIMLSGVAVTASRPTAPSNTITATAKAVPTRCAIGAVTSHPTSPPEPTMDSHPSEGAGDPIVMCHRPIPEIIRSSQPPTSRALASVGSGLRI